MTNTHLWLRARKDIPLIRNSSNSLHIEIWGWRGLDITIGLSNAIQYEYSGDKKGFSVPLPSILPISGIMFLSCSKVVRASNIEIWGWRGLDITIRLSNAMQYEYSGDKTGFSVPLSSIRPISGIMFLSCVKVVRASNKLWWSSTLIWQWPGYS